MDTSVSIFSIKIPQIIDKPQTLEYNNKHRKNKEKSHILSKVLEGGEQMSEIKVNNGNIEDALKRFKRQCARNGVIQEVRKREHYEKPSVRRKKKSEAARKRKF